MHDNGMLALATACPERRSSTLWAPEAAAAEFAIQIRLLPKDNLTYFARPTIIVAAPPANATQRWSRLSEQIFRVDKWSLCQG